jgi:hypothetical protein
MRHTAPANPVGLWRHRVGTALQHGFLRLSCYNGTWRTVGLRPCLRALIERANGRTNCSGSRNGCPRRGAILHGTAVRHTGSADCCFAFRSCVSPIEQASLCPVFGRREDVWIPPANGRRKGRVAAAASRGLIPLPGHGQLSRLLPVSKMHAIQPATSDPAK